MSLTLALYQPEIPPNCGNMMRTCACLGATAAIIEPAGFDTSDKNFRRAGLDYLPHVAIDRYENWSAFEIWRRAAGRRLVLLTTKGAVPYTDFAFADGDVLMVGRESAGVPDEVHVAADARVVIPVRPGLRSLNVAVSAGMALGEAFRQIKLRSKEEQARK